VSSAQARVRTGRYQEPLRRLIQVAPELPADGGRLLLLRPGHELPRRLSGCGDRGRAGQRDSRPERVAYWSAGPGPGPGPGPSVASAMPTITAANSPSSGPSPATLVANRSHCGPGDPRERRALLEGTERPARRMLIPRLETSVSWDAEFETDLGDL